MRGYDLTDLCRDGFWVKNAVANDLQPLAAQYAMCVNGSNSVSLAGINK